MLLLYMSTRYVTITQYSKKLSKDKKKFTGIDNNFSKIKLMNL